MLVTFSVDIYRVGSTEKWSLFTNENSSQSWSSNDMQCLTDFLEMKK